MRTARHLATLALLAAGAALAACDNPNAPEQRSESELTFIAATPNAPPLAALQASVWAKVGETRHVPIPYVSQNGYSDECLDFIIPANALWKRPDGTRFAAGDSVLITVRVVDPKLFNFDFQPAGLQFDGRHPAEIRVSYKWANLAGITSFGFWRQENVGDPWLKLHTVNDTNAQEIRAEVTGFTRYAVAAE
jgi:hypothetical protein